MRLEEQLNIFGVRHLSPGASYHLLDYLNEKKPKCVLIEGPVDASAIVLELANKNVKPPVALLTYTTELPVETALYPFAEYSPEFQAIAWGVKNKADVRLIDLPSDIMLKLKQNWEADTEEGQAYYEYHNDLYSRLSALHNEADYESYWERNFEHNLNKGNYQQGICFQSGEMRELVEGREYHAVPSSYAYNMLRESHMKREIWRAVDSGFRPEDIVIVVGAYHVSGIRSELPPLTDDEWNDIPRVNTLLTLMPYSYYRLSSRTGYGAGNKAPYYFEQMWQCMKKNTMSDLPAVYIARVAGELRKAGHHASSASVIEAVRLAGMLSAMRSGVLPVLNDLHDAIVTCLGEGEVARVAEALNRADIGTAIGSLPEGLSQTPVQEDMNNQLKRLKLTTYKSAIQQDITLDLRENIKVKSAEAAFIDLHRSTFFHRLCLLRIQFAKPVALTQHTATWAEKWVLQWTPEVEIEIVESNLKGESIEIAAAFELKEQLHQCESVSKAAELIRLACECGLVDNFSNAIHVLQGLLIDSTDFKEIAFAARELSMLIKYGNIRRFDLEPLVPILQQLFLRASLLLVDACSCDDKAATEIMKAINTMDIISQEDYERVNSTLWQQEVEKLARRDDRNSKLSGVAFSILLAHNLVSDEDCAREVSLRLSPGIPAELGAGWFEGLASRNHYALLSRISLWKELDGYVQSLSEEEFFRSVVFLRRAFGSFESSHKNSIAELLGDLWGTGAEATAEFLQTELSEDESQKLDELNDFDFGDLI